MKKEQKMIFETNVLQFWSEVNKLLIKGWLVLPGTLVIRDDNVCVIVVEFQHP
jgi:hypothetical protein